MSQVSSLFGGYLLFHFFLFRLSENSTIDELLDERSFTIKLIDWGRAIDMSALKGQTFTGRAGTECFDCFEMMVKSLVYVFLSRLFSFYFLFRIICFL